MKKLILLACIAISLISCKKKDDPKPSTPSNDVNKVIGVWQSIKQRNYVLHQNGSITDENTTIINDSTQIDECPAYEFTSSKNINLYTASYYESWNKDTVIVTSNWGKYSFEDNNTIIKMYFDNDDPSATFEITSLSSTDMVLSQKTEDGNDKDVIEFTYKKINGHKFSDFVFYGGN